MAVINSKSGMGGYTPMCGSCGIALCWDISELEYAELKEFWDSWECKECNPNAIGARRRYQEEHSIKNKYIKLPRKKYAPKTNHS